ncbi:MAG: TIGR00282 family metallophosphoesterase [Spirochaetia bacterium]|jgi:metallophosphoesterase (TIGR00282 family)|nr:TIGR00282 family metallophosphoesterase [Spirochaetia bacterium]
MAEGNIITALVLGDVCGQPGMRALFMGLGQLMKDYHSDVVVVNGENAAAGFGLAEEQKRQLFSLGVDVITSGNHIWQQEDLVESLKNDPYLLRPLNYPPKVLGHGSAIVERKGYKIAVLNLQGRVNMPITDCPFRCGADAVRNLQNTVSAILIDFHAESPEEKKALAFHLDGSVSAVLGTHTHVQTNDEMILPKGTGFITDLGICGPSESVIGSDPALSIQKQMTQMPLRTQIADTAPMICGVCLKIDGSNGHTLAIERIMRKFTF